MEDIDNINLSILKELGCVFPEINSIGQFASEHIVFTCAVLLRVISNNGIKLPKKLPEGKASRFRVCTDLSTAISGLGYTGEIGYESFLYPNEKDMRQLIIFMISKLPKVDEEVEQEQRIGQGGLNAKKILGSLELFRSKAAKWNKLVSTKDVHASFQTTPIYVPSKTNISALKDYNSSKICELINYQAGVKFIPSTLERNTEQVALYVEAQKKWNNQGLEGSKEAQLARKKLLQKSIADAFAASIKASTSLATDGLSASSIQEVASGSLGYNSDPSKSMASVISDLLQTSSGAVANTSNLFSRRAEFGVEKGDTIAHVVEGAGTAVQIVETDDGVKKVGDLKQDEEDLVAKREEEMASLHAQLSKEVESVNELKKQLEGFAISQKEIEDEKKKLQDSNTAAELEYKTKKATLDLLPDASKNIQLLSEMVETNKKRLVDFQKQWEGVKEPYLEEYNRKKNVLANRKEECRVKLDQIKRMREDMKDMMNQLRERDEQYALVVEELNRLPKSVNRQVYVKRIMDIVRNLERQKVDIKRILADIRDVQKDINTVSATASRSFALADDIIFKTAQTTKDAAAAKGYGYLVQLRDKFDDLISIVESTGSTRNEIRDMESRCEALQERSVNLNMERVQTDYDAVKAENAALAKQLGLKKI